MSNPFTDILTDVAKIAPDQNEAVAGGGGGGREIPAKGTARLRLVSYIEVGKHAKAFGKYAGKIEDQAWLVFELSGKNYEPREVEGVGLIPHRITVKLNLSLNEKATYFKLFQRLNWDRKATHFSQLLGKPFLGTVGHFSFKGADGNDITIANFRGDDGALTIRPPRIETLDEDGEMVSKTVKVAEPISELRLFIWDGNPDWYGKMWGSLYIEGKADTDYDPNVFQKTIREALNFKGSPIDQWLQSKGDDMGAPDAKAPEEEDGDDDLPWDEEADAPKPKKEAPSKPAPKKRPATPRKADPLGEDDPLNDL